MELIYQFIQEPLFGHNFDEVDYEHNEFDQKLGVKGLHTVRKKVTFKPRRTILPPDLFAKYHEMDFWHDNTGTASNIITAKQQSATKEYDNA